LEHCVHVIDIPMHLYY